MIPPQHKFAQHKNTTLDGQRQHKARFGLAVACAGNLNLDGITRDNSRGIEDLVVGAPYDGPDGRGAVYIYLGGPDGVVNKHAQVTVTSVGNIVVSSCCVLERTEMATCTTHFTCTYIHAHVLSLDSLDLVLEQPKWP